MKLVCDSALWPVPEQDASPNKECVIDYTADDIDSEISRKRQI